jgi:hypothetical protein
VILVDFGVAAVIVIAVVILGSLWYRHEYQKLNPPPTKEEQIAMTEKKIARLEEELGMKEGG